MDDKKVKICIVIVTVNHCSYDRHGNNTVVAVVCATIYDCFSLNCRSSFLMRCIRFRPMLK